MTTTDDRIRNLEIALSRAISDKEIARHDANTYRTAAGFLWASLEAVLTEYKRKGRLSESIIEQAEAALAWTPAQEGEAG